ncbi:DEAD/DEAH box helicase [Corynebacterium mayonis]|uniref:DEAD/DEAH box helicase n=1 Tax=Corynebacterium mayonis TaxID=3062461 RepID=UPI0031408463
MKYTLKPYQETASREILERLDDANQVRSIGKQAAFALSAPTGAGKTVIATDVFEKLLLPSDDRVPDEKAVIIWFSDNPDLNRQSRYRIEGASSTLHGRTVEIDNSFIKNEFEAGKIYFLNTQKLSKGTVLTGGRKKNGSNFELFDNAPDLTQVTIWDTLRNTLESPDHNVYFVVDEAHRGSGKQSDRETILQRLIAGHTPDGATATVPPMPVVVGISATPGKFKKMLNDMPGARMVLEDVDVPTDEVQESGLLKDIVELQIPGEEGEAFENIFVRQAARLLAESTRRWSEYHIEQGGDDKRVVPLMVVQMQDLATPENMYRVISALREGWPELPHDCFAHVFGEHAPIQAGDTVIPYIEPQHVEDREWIRVLFAKTAISTGWDCPRAEVMVSYRPANDEDFITQIIGRMVRSPLARRIPGDDLLNSVLCLLPRFNRAAAERVVMSINRPGEIDPPPFINPVVKPETLLPIDNDALWAAFTALPTEVAPKRSGKPISRLINAGIELEVDGLMPDGEARAKKELVSIVNALLVRYADEVETKKKDILKVETQRLTYRYSDRGLKGEDSIELVADDRVITESFELATPVFSRALANLWVNDYLVAGLDNGEADEDLIIEAHLTLGALAKVEGAKDSLWREADQTAKAWLDQHRADISALPDSRQAKYTVLREMAEAPSAVFLEKPKNRMESPGVWNSEKKELDPYPRYDNWALVAENGSAPANLNDWEIKVVETEMARHGAVSWYRNPSRPGRDALSAVYYDEATGRWRSVQPDFIFFLRDSEGAMRASIVDPHGAYLGDALGKLRGLARYAEQYGDRFVRIESVSGADAKSLRVLDLKSEAVRAAVVEAASAEAVYEKLGYAYK